MSGAGGKIEGDPTEELELEWGLKSDKDLQK